MTPPRPTQAELLTLAEQARGQIAQALDTPYRSPVMTAMVLEDRLVITARRPENGRRDDEDHNPTELTASGTTLEELETALNEECERIQSVRAYAGWLQTLPPGQRREQIEHAKKILSVEHKVYLGGRCESPERFAIGLLENEYNQEVEDAVELIKTNLKNGDTRNQDQYYEDLYQVASVDGDEDACRILLCSHHYNEETDATDLATRAASAFRADIEESLRRDGIVGHEIEETDCAACGRVVIWSDDTEECPKCSLPFAITKERGYVVNGEPMCDGCHTDETTTPLATGEYECRACGDSYYNPPPKDPT